MKWPVYFIETRVYYASYKKNVTIITKYELLRPVFIIRYKVYVLWLENKFTGFPQLPNYLIILSLTRFFLFTLFVDPHPVNNHPIYDNKLQNLSTLFPGLLYYLVGAAKS